MEHQTAVDRLRIFAAWTKSMGYVRSEREFETVCGLSNGYMNNLQSKGKGCVGSDKIALILKRFPMLNAGWLCSGDGLMTNEHSQDFNLAEIEHHIDEIKRCLERINPGRK